MTYATFQGAAIDIVATQLAYGHRCVLVGIHLDECKAPIGLKARLRDESKILEKWHKIILCGVWCEISNVAGSLPCRSLRNDHFVALHPVCWEMMMAVGGCWCHTHGGHRLLLGDRWLAFLVGPIASDGSGSKPFAVHGT